MDKMTFASYKFKANDVIEGLNRYFADAKANRYRRASLEIKNGEVKHGNYYVLRNIVFNVDIPKVVKEYGYLYLICDPEEVVGVAINWLREEHDIFYTPGMEVPGEDFDTFDAAREYEKETRKDRIEELKESRWDLIESLQRRLHEAKRRIIALEEGHVEKTKIIDRQKTVIQEQRVFITEVAELLETGDPYIEREYKAAIDVLSNIVKHPNLHRWRYNDLKNEILKVYREIFDCSNGDPEGSDEETMQDILTEYQRVLMLKNVAEEKAIKWKELARENEEQTNKYKKLTRELDRYKWLYENLKNGVESVLQEAEEKED